MMVAAVHDKGDDEDRTKMEGTGDRLHCHTMRNTKRGPRDVIDISLAIGKFFSYSFHFLLLKTFFDINY
jgi:hypothetical protein